MAPSPISSPRRSSYKYHKRKRQLFMLSVIHAVQGHLSKHASDTFLLPCLESQSVETRLNYSSTNIGQKAPRCYLNDVVHVTTVLLLDQKDSMQGASRTGTAASSSKSLAAFRNFSLIHQNGNHLLPQPALAINPRSLQLTIPSQSPAGKMVFFRNFNGEKLDQSFSLVFATSLINFSKTLLNEEVRDVTTQNNRIFLKEIGQVRWIKKDLQDYRVPILRLG